MASGKIDTHQHFFPKAYVDGVGLDTLARQMPNQKAPEWSPERAITMMDANGISEGILSVSSGPPIPDAPTLLRKCNDAAAELRQLYPGRFGSFASLPLPDIDASLKELAYSLDTLKADGFIIFASYGGKYLGDELFAPLLEELNRRKTVAFIQCLNSRSKPRERQRASSSRAHSSGFPTFASSSRMPAARSPTSSRGYRSPFQ